METRKEKIRELFKKVIYKDGDIYVFHSKKAMDKLINDILAIPLDVPSEEELEPYFTYKKPYIEDEDCSKTYFAFNEDELDAVKLFWKWAIEQVKERNQK